MKSTDNTTMEQPVKRGAAEVDMNRLHEEWEEQPRLYDRFAEKLANARLTLDELKNELEVLEAEADLRIRREPSRYGIDKVSEGAIKSAIILDKKVREAKNQISAAKHRVDILTGRVTALDHRKKSLEKLVDLRLSHYWSEPKASKRVQQPDQQKVHFDRRAK